MRNCNSCGAELVPVSDLGPQRRRDDYQNFTDALHIRCYGGYGEYVDEIFGAFDDIIICKACADALMADNPWLKNIVNPDIPEGVAKPR